MSILGAMYTAVSGLNAQSQSLGNISDNIANSQTVGYKKVNTRFSDLITISNKSLNLPGGVIASPYYANALQGNINQTQSTTNLAVSGNGFFVVSQPTSQNATQTTFSALPYYTRAGDFEVNRDGYVVNGGGYYLNGWTVDELTGVPDTASLAPIQVTQLTTPPNPTSKIEVTGNLPATSVVNPDPPLPPTNIKIYDALGNPHTVSLTWVKRADNIWNLDITAADSTLDPVAGVISGTNDQTAVAAPTTPNTPGVAQVDTITVPTAGLAPGRTLSFTIGSNTVPVTAPIGGYTGSQLATALAAAVNANAGMAAVVTAGNVIGNTLTVTADVAGTAFTGSLAGNGSGQVDTVTIPGALVLGDTLSVDVAGGGPFTVAGPSSVSAARTSLINQINAAALGVTAIADPNNASRIMIQSDTAGGSFAAAAAGAGNTVAATYTTEAPTTEVTTTLNVVPVAQVDTVTLGGTVGPGEIGDTWSITIGTQTVTYVNDGTETTLTDIANGFAARINAASGLGVTASVSGSQIVLTASTPGTPFTETVAATNGNVPGLHRYPLRHHHGYGGRAGLDQQPVQPVRRCHRPRLATARRPGPDHFHRRLRHRPADGGARPRSFPDYRRPDPVLRHQHRHPAPEPGWAAPGSVHRNQHQRQRRRRAAIRQRQEPGVLPRAARPVLRPDRAEARERAGLHRDV
jgi:flagellar hook protein FlgE